MKPKQIRFVLIVAMIATIAVCGTALAEVHACTGTPVDQNKLRDTPGRGYIHFWVESVPPDTSHSEGEEIKFAPDTTDHWKGDLSCWMATAYNLLEYANPPHWNIDHYKEWLKVGFDLPPEGPLSNWGYDPGHRGAFTFDDPARTEFALIELGYTIEGPIDADLQTMKWTTVNPLTWVAARLDDNRPVSILYYWYVPPDPPNPAQWGNHWVTLYRLDTTAHEVRITDSDDLPGTGTKDCNYTYVENDLWTMEDTCTCTIISAVALSGQATPVESTTWGRIKAMYQ